MLPIDNQPPLPLRLNITCWTGVARLSSTRWASEMGCGIRSHGQVTHLFLFSSFNFGFCETIYQYGALHLLCRNYDIFTTLSQTVFPYQQRCMGRRTGEGKEWRAEGAVLCLKETIITIVEAAICRSVPHTCGQNYSIANNLKGCIPYPSAWPLYWQWCACEPWKSSNPQH